MSDPLTTEPKLDPAFKAKWLEALRGGSYAQTQTRLRSPENGFCCLGVACDIINPDKWSGVPQRNYGDPGYDWGDRLTGDVDSELDRAIGTPEGTAKLLSVMNDEKGASFIQIADWIEANL